MIIETIDTKKRGHVKLDPPLNFEYESHGLAVVEWRNGSYVVLRKKGSHQTPFRELDTTDAEWWAETYAWRNMCKCGAMRKTHKPQRRYFCADCKRKSAKKRAHAKANKEKRVHAPPKPKPRKPRICVVCAVDFTNATTQRRKFCSAACSDHRTTLYHRQKKKEVGNQ